MAEVRVHGGFDLRGSGGVLENRVFLCQALCPCGDSERWSSQAKATKFLSLGCHEALQRGQRGGCDREGAWPEKHGKDDKHRLSSTSARIYNGVMTGQDAQSPFQLPIFQDNIPSESKGNEASAFRGEVVKKSIGWQDVRVESREPMPWLIPVSESPRSRWHKVQEQNM